MPSLADLSPAASPRSGCCCWYKELPGGGLWGLSIVQGPFSVAPRQTATLRFATFQPPVGGRRTRSGCTRRSRRCARHGPPTAPGTASRTHTGTSTSYACTCNQAHQGPPLKSNRGFNRVLNTPIGARRRAHPWFFSMGRLHLGHGLELARIQFMFSLSALFFITHLVAQKCPVSVPPPPTLGGTGQSFQAQLAQPGRGESAAASGAGDWCPCSGVEDGRPRWGWSLVGAVF
jgi:hypothetical protein